MKSKTLLALLIFSVIFWQNSFSQAPSIEWQNAIGGSLNDEAKSIQQTLDGGYIAGGSSLSGATGDKSESSFGGYDYWVVKLNSIGAIEWQNTLGGSSDDILSCVWQCSDEGYIIGGWSISGVSSDKSEASLGSYDYWVVRLNSSGEIEWENTIGGSAFDYLHSVQQTIDGGFILGGYSASGISGDKTEASKGDHDYWVVKLNSSGVIEWQKTIGGNKFDELYSIRQCTDGGYILGGNSSSAISGDKSEGSLGKTDYWLVKLSSTGSIEWDNTIGGNKVDYLNCVEQTSDGGFILGGWSLSGLSGDKSEQGFTDYDYWIIKVNSSGIIEWQNTIGGNSYDVAPSIKQTEDGYIVGGYSESGISGDKTESAQEPDWWIVKLDNAGNIEWQETIGGDDFDFLWAVDVTTDGGFILGGYTFSGMSGDKSEESMGGSDMWIMKLADFLSCTIPTSRFTSNISSSSAKVNWGSVNGANKYKVRYKKSNTTDWTIVSASTTQKKIEGLLPSSEYKWQVKSICTDENLGKSDWSPSEIFTTSSLKLGDQISGEDFKVYPNPASDFATIQFTLANSSDAEISLLDLQGRKIKTIAEGNFEGGNHALNFSVEDLQKGIYFLQLQTLSAIQTQKIIVQ